MPFKPWLSLCLTALLACNDNSLAITSSASQSQQTVGNPYGRIDEIPLPAGYKRVMADAFGSYLRNLKLKKDRTVYLYNGLPKKNQSAQFAVLDLSTGNRDLQQCADAVMRLRSDFLFAAGQYDEIVFTDNNGKSLAFQPPYTRENLGRYQQRVFGICGSASLSKQLKRVAGFSSIEPGYVFIRGGFPGHAVMVMDVAENESGEKIYLLAQGFMPAQDMHILVNPSAESWSPWYKAGEDEWIQTPEYVFRSTELSKW